MNRMGMIVATMWILLSGSSLGAWAEELAVIVNAKNPIGNLNPAEIRKYFLKEQQTWPNGEKVRSVDRNGSSAERRVFLEKVLKLTPDEMEQYWISIRYQKGIAVPPKLHTDQEVVEYVGAYGGAIGYVNSTNLGGAQKSEIKVIGTIPMP
jgi:ABC-type phosphate transport system substrate-binding protein